MGAYDSQAPVGRSPVRTSGCMLSDTGAIDKVHDRRSEVEERNVGRVKASTDADMWVEEDELLSGTGMTSSDGRVGHARLRRCPPHLDPPSPMSDSVGFSLFESSCTVL